VIVYCCVASISAALVAQAAAVPSVQGTDLQSRDEVDGLTRLSPYLDVTWIERGIFSAELPNPAGRTFGTDWNFGIGKKLVITPSYYYFSFRTTSGAAGHVHSPILAATPIFSRGRWTASDRNRFGGRFGTSGIGPSWAYRNRPRIDYRIGPSRWKTALFAWDEVFYFSKYSGFTRNRVAAGGRKEFTERLAADLYYQREDDERGTPARINTVGLQFEVRIRREANPSEANMTGEPGIKNNIQ
jgi:hypothetical protein